MEQDNSGNINNRYLYMMMLWYPDYITNNNNSLYNYNNNNDTDTDNDTDTELMNTILNISMNDYMSKYKNIISEEGLTQLNHIKYTFIENNNNIYNKSCPIMMYEFEENQEIIQLPCNHCYDPDAIKKWVNEEKAECPICRYKLKSKEIKIECNSNNNNYFDNYTNNELNEIRTYITDYLLEEQQYRDNIYTSLARIILGEDVENEEEDNV